MAGTAQSQEWKVYQTTRVPHIRDLQSRGVIEGSLIRSARTGAQLCYYYGGLPYALPPVGQFRWRRPRPLPRNHRYGTQANPGRHTGIAGVCPQVGRDPNMDPSWSEDCLQVNIWIPYGEPPDGGWPVYFYIHGGFLQWGSPNLGDPTALLAETDCKFIVVKIAYRLGIFGFLASQDLLDDAANKDTSAGNLGFWDIRLALEWTHQNIKLFSGNPSNITVGGYSAGAHSTFYQLQYDIALPPSKRVVKRAVMLSNGPGIQPKTIQEAQHQFNELLHKLNIPLTLSATEKMARLRKLPWQVLLKAVSRMDLHQFRAVLDDSFISHDLFPSILRGTFAKRLKAANVQLLMGECNAEHHVYGGWKPPSPGPNNLFKRLHSDYPRHAVEILVRQYLPDGRLPPAYKSWQDLFGHIYADVQIHVTQRGLVESLVKHGAGRLVRRYRIEYRVGLADIGTPREWGATHASDMFMWWFGDGYVLEDREKEIARKGLLQGFAKFIKGEKDDGFWGKDPKECRTLKSDGSVDFWRDEWWEGRLRVWRALEKVMDGAIRAKL